MVQLIVQGEELDLFKNEVFAISKAVSKVGQFDLRFGDVSVSFNVPSTSKNNRIFRYLSNLNNQNIGAFKRFEGEIREDDAVLSAGYFQVLSTNTNKKTFKIRFYGGNSDWFDLIKDRFVNVDYFSTTSNPNDTTYTLSDLNHKYEQASITSSRDNTEGYFYFICDSGIDSNKSDNVVTLQDFQVGVYEHTIFKKIFDSIGVKTKGSLFNDPLFYSTIITGAQDLTQFEGQNNNKRFTTIGGDTITKDTYSAINFNLSDQDAQWDGDTFTAGSDIVDLVFDLKYIASRGTFYAGQYGDLEVKCEYSINGVPQADIEVILTEESSGVGGTGNVFVEFSTEVFNFTNVKEDDYFIFSIRNVNQTTPPFDGFWNTIKKLTYVEAYLKYDITGANTPYPINNAMPKIKQSDFIKDILFRFGCISQYDPKKRVLSIDKFQDVDRNKNIAEDLTDKIDVSKDIEVNFTKVVENYFKTSFIRYKEDENDVQLRWFKAIAKSGLGDGVITIDNDNLTDEGDIFESQYSATKDVITWNEDFYIPYIPVYNGDDINDLKPRVLVALPSTSITDFNKTYTNIDIEGVIHGNIGYAYFAKQITSEIGVITPELDTNLFTLSFENFTLAGQTYIGNTLLDKNYDLYKRILNNPVYLPIYLNLKNTDVQNFDFLIPKWLDFGLDSGYYYADEISQYKGDGSTTKVPLIKI